MNLDLPIFPIAESRNLLVSYAPRVERRRIYDIVNVLESIGVLARKAKNRYSWKGFGGVPKTLQQLREEGLRENFNTFNGNNYVKVSDDDEDEKISNPITSQNDKLNPSSVTKSSTASKTGILLLTDNRKEKSLGLLTQNFVKLFLCSNVDLISLEEAAKILLGDAHDPSMMRTKVRRLYDIANVLSSMNFIEKTHHPETRKPAFRWLGTRGKSDNGSANTSVLNESKKRIFGTEITNTSFKRTKVVSTIDENSKQITKTHLQMLVKCEDLENEVDKSNFEQDLRHSSKNFQFGPFAPVTVHVSKFGATQNSTVKQVHDWESLASTYRPQYYNQGNTGFDMFQYCFHLFLSFVCMTCEPAIDHLHLCMTRFLFCSDEQSKGPYGLLVTSFWAALSFVSLFAYPTPEFPTPSFEYHTAFSGVALGIVSTNLILFIV
ncbi:hypothetical protein TEA_021761 [Camellia sinensis var. sinensis]|uniref:E2F/DP family winged-helix DNA-binding domain-containing protein n=1 Tax=Camellia sinensis var. sinensis TaxID=542762 RepID=A0A4V6RYT0_CAMSN|nr:hypothetical protein TEA_021761 [Camellia sinensis var. sinensis]